MDSGQRNDLPPSLREIRTGFQQFLQEPSSTSRKRNPLMTIERTTTKRRMVGESTGLSVGGNTDPLVHLETPVVANRKLTRSFLTKASPSPGGLPALLSTPGENTDIRELRLQLSKAKYEASRAQSELEHERLTHESERLEWEKTLKEHTLRLDRLEKDRRFLFEKEKEASEKYFQAENEMQTLKDDYEKRIHQVREQATEWLEQYQADAAKQDENGAQAQIEAWRDRVAGYEKTVAQLQDQLEERAISNEETLKSCLQAQNRANQLEQELAGLRAGQHREHELGSLSGELKHQVGYIKTLESKIRGLQQELESYESRHENYELLQEKNSELEQRVRLLEPLRDELTTLETEITQMREEKAQWQSSLQNILDVNKGEPDGPQSENLDPSTLTPLRLTDIAIQQRREIAALYEQMGTLRADASGTHVEVRDLQQQLSTAQSRVTQLEQQHSRDKRTLQRLEKLRVLAQRETEFLREQLKSYDMEELSFADDGPHDKVKSQRIAELEQLVQEYRDQVVRLNEQLTQRPTPAESTGQLVPHGVLEDQSDANVSAQLAQDNEALRREQTRLQQLLDKQERELTLLEHRVGLGDYNPRTTRVLQLAENPTSQAYAIRETTLQNLRLENEQLREQLTQSKSPGVGESGPTPSLPSQTVQNLLADHKAMQHQVEEKEKRMRRLKEGWRAKAQEMREAVYSLLGYRVDFLENGRVRLTSMYSEAADHSFIFTSSQNDSGTLELVGGGNAGYVRSLDHLIKFWVVGRGSIPAFLATVTLELFDKTTAMMPPGHHVGWRGRDEMSESMTMSLATTTPSTQEHDGTAPNGSTS
ncbi:coiled-coil domain-containing protein mad1 [Dispira parvispora]|uniref:Spindle assembly checkpoint component MAD1 n=1 Tax=Dispira parvispora TaxID=1520584 RepID=A0A9W8ASM6_9FUNG|nr:coiled-coil domain-containing protein mad1 [Dispira parvispora]